jgi:hypothetical protein
MPQQMDLRIIESAMITIPQNFAARLQMNRDAEPFGTCVEMSTLPRTRSKGAPRISRKFSWRSD